MNGHHPIDSSNSKNEGSQQDCHHRASSSRLAAHLAVVNLLQDRLSPTEQHDKQRTTKIICRPPRNKTSPPTTKTKAANKTAIIALHCHVLPPIWGSLICCETACRPLNDNTTNNEQQK
jgi:hypothetical protein